MVLSASSVASLQAGDSSFTVFLKQAQFALLGVAVGAGASLVPVWAWRRLALPLLAAAILSQLLVFTPFGITVMGNRNWLRLGPVQLQPSEVGKLALIVYGAAILTTKRRMLRRWQHVLVPLLVPAGMSVVGLVLAGHDLGTGLVLIAILAGMLWGAGVPTRLFALAGVSAAGGVAALVLLSGNRMSRLDQWLNCTGLHQCWQTSQARFALAEVARDLFETQRFLRTAHS